MPGAFEAFLPGVGLLAICSVRWQPEQFFLVFWAAEDASGYRVSAFLCVATAPTVPLFHCPGRPPQERTPGYPLIRSNRLPNSEVVLVMGINMSPFHVPLKLP